MYYVSIFVAENWAPYGKYVSLNDALNAARSWLTGTENGETPCTCFPVRISFIAE